MVNVLIANDNLYYAKNLANYIFSRDAEMKLVNISTNGLEVLDTILSKELTVDIVILDLKMPSLSGVEVLEKLEKENIEYKLLIIVLSGETDLISRIRDNSLVSYYINKSE